jgi:hypothetical protein
VDKLDKLLGGCPGYPLDLSAAEQQVWLDAQRAMLEAGYRKPQQPAEGELAPNPHKECNAAECIYEDWLEDDERKDRFCEDLKRDGFNEGRQAQRAFDLAKMLPSEDELADRLRKSFEENGYRNYKETAHELLRLLGERT